MVSRAQSAGHVARRPRDAGSWLALSAANEAAFWEYAPRMMGQRWARWEDVRAADPGSAHPIPNSATLVRPLDAAGAPALIEQLSAFYDAAPGAPWVLWSAWPLPDMAPCGCDLLSRPPLMVRPPGGGLLPAPPALRIVEVADSAGLADFEEAFILGYPLPELQPARRGVIYDVRVLGGPLRLWVGYVDDRPVTVAAAFVDSAVTGIYCVATVPEARGRGYGAAVTTQAVLAEPALPAVLQASDMGYPVYRRLGFQEVARYSLWLRPRAT